MEVIHGLHFQNLEANMIWRLMMALNTNYVDDILASSNTQRKYKITNNTDGTVSIEDVTEYQQIGSRYGAKDINEERVEINGITDRFTDGLHMQYFEIQEGQTVLYLRLGKTAWNKGFAFIMGCDNIDYVLSETVFAYYNDNTELIQFHAEGPFKDSWKADQEETGSNVQIILPTYSQGIVFWYGFEAVGTV